MPTAPLGVFTKIHGDLIIIISIWWPDHVIQNGIPNFTALQMLEHIDGLVQENVTPLLTHWSYVFLELTHRYEWGSLKHLSETIPPLSGSDLPAACFFCFCLLNVSERSVLFQEYGSPFELKKKMFQYNWSCFRVKWDLCQILTIFFQAFSHFSQNCISLFFRRTQLSCAQIYGNKTIMGYFLNGRTI